MERRCLCILALYGYNIQRVGKGFAELQYVYGVLLFCITPQFWGIDSYIVCIVNHAVSPPQLKCVVLNIHNTMTLQTLPANLNKGDKLFHLGFFFKAHFRKKSNVTKKSDRHKSINKPKQIKRVDQRVAGTQIRWNSHWVQEKPQRDLALSDTMNDKISEYRKTPGRPQPQSRSRWTVCWFHIDFCQQLSASHDAPAAAKLALIGILAPIGLIKDEGGKHSGRLRLNPMALVEWIFCCCFSFKDQKIRFILLWLSGPSLGHVIVDT